MDTSVDAVVIGSGVCGAIVAERLAAGGRSVIILEAGETGPPREELVGTYVTASKKTMNSPYRQLEPTRWVPSPDGANDPYYDQDRPSFKSTYTRRVGGSTWHWRGNVPRFIPQDFQLYSTYGVGVDWPIGYDDLESYYCQVERELGVSGSHEEWHGYKGAYRSQPFPMSEIWESYGDTLVAERINRLEIDGIPLRLMRTPQARNSQPYDGRPPCAGNSTCDPICPIGAKYDATVHIGKAMRAGATLWEKCVATKLHVDADRLIQAVTIRRWPTLVSETIHARLFVLAGHAIESPKLLLMSKCEYAPAGVANSSDLVGRFLMDHLQGQGAAILPFPVFPFRGPPTTSGIDSFRDGSFRRNHAAFRMSIGNDGWGLVQGPYSTLTSMVRFGEGGMPLFGSRLRSRLRDRITRQFRVSYSTETLPDPENRVELSSRLDEMGMPKPRISFKPSEYQVRAFRKGQEVIAEIFRCLDATEISLPEDARAYSSANHILGTCRMGRDARTSVVDATCRSHDHRNLFIVGASVFPTAGTGNPTLTAVAVLLRSMTALKNTLQER